MANALMKAAWRDRYGPPEVVEIREVVRPVPTGDQVLVRVRAASVNRADLDTIEPRPGFIRPIIGMRAPRNRRMGIDVAGTVEAVGPDAGRFRIGDAVFADLYGHGEGAFAEFACATEKAFEPIPTGVPFEQAATLPHSAILALQGLRTRDGRTLEAGLRVLIVGASGNVGPFAVQLAKLMGAHVTGVCRTEKVEFVRSLGADEVIDYTKVDYTTTGQQWDWILETDSHHSIRAVRRALAPDGRFHTLGGTAWPILEALTVGPLISLFSDRWSGLMLWWKPFDPDDVAYLGGLVAAGKLVPAIDSRYPLDEIVPALRRVHEGLARGKVLITF